MNLDKDDTMATYTSLILEKLYENMDEAMVGKWLAKPGEQVQAGQILAELISDKMSAELEAPENGVFGEIFVAEKSTVPFGTVLAVMAPGSNMGWNAEEIRIANQQLLAERRQDTIGTPLTVAVSPVPAASIPAASVSTTVSVSVAAKRPVPVVSPASASDVMSGKISPAARIFAQQAGVDVAEVVAVCGKEWVHRQDVQAYLESRQHPSALPPGVETEVPPISASVVVSTDKVEPGARRVALITGASGGIGLAVACRLAKQGVDLALHGHAQVERLTAEKVNLAKSGIRVEVFSGDLLVSGGVEALVSAVMASFGRIDILVCAAGVLADAPVAFMQDEQWQRVLQLNLTVPFQLTRAVAMPMSRRRWGRIIYLSSAAGQLGSANRSNYAAAKEGLLGFCRSVARELAPMGVTVNAVCPGFIDTPMTAGIAEKKRAELAKEIPLRRFGQANEVAELVTYLTGEAAAYVTGQALGINGGLHM